MFTEWNARLPAIRDADYLRALATWLRRHADDADARARILERDAERSRAVARRLRDVARERDALPDHELTPDERRGRLRRRRAARNIAIVRDAARGFTNAQLRVKYGLHPSTVSRIVQRALRHPDRFEGDRTPLRGIVAQLLGD